jgi:uncharacterized membrane protein
MKNDETWRKSQRFGGISLILCGLIVTIGAVFIFRGESVILWMLICLLFVVIIDVAYTYIIANRGV